MVAGLSKLALVVIFSLSIGVTHSSRTSLRQSEKQQNDAKQVASGAVPPPPEEIEYITMEDIDAMMALEDFESLMTDGKGGLRKLSNINDICKHGGQSNQVLTWLGRTWGSCQTMNPCMCGMHPIRMAYWCTDLCLPACGGKCATPNNCPAGFNIGSNGQLVDYQGDPSSQTFYPSFCKSKCLGCESAFDTIFVLFFCLPITWY